MAGLGDIAAKFTPSIGASGLVSAFLLVGVAIAVLLAVAVGVWYIMHRLSFKVKIEVFKKVGSSAQRVITDRARVVKFSQAGDFALQLRKSKKYLLNPQHQVSKNLYWYYIREDDEWINVWPEDVDETSRTMRIKFTDADMRFSRIAIERNLDKEFQKTKFLEKYGGLIAYMGLIIVTAVAFWFILDKALEAMSIANQVLQVQAEVASKLETILGAMEQLTATSGVVGV